MGFHNGPLADESKRQEMASDLMNLFDKCLPMVSDHTSLDSTPNDEYAVLAGHILWDLWHETRENKHFWMGVTFLLYALKLSPSNYSMRFLLIKFFNGSGAIGCSLEIHSGLELKQIQLESLGYLVARHIQTCGYVKDSQSEVNIVARTLSFLGGSYKDVSLLS